MLESLVFLLHGRFKILKTSKVATSWRLSPLQDLERARTSPMIPLGFLENSWQERHYTTHQHSYLGLGYKSLDLIITLRCLSTPPHAEDAVFLVVAN